MPYPPWKPWTRVGIGCYWIGQKILHMYDDSENVAWYIPDYELVELAAEMCKVPDTRV